MTDTARCECDAPATASLVFPERGSAGWWRCDECGRPIDWTAMPTDEELTLRIRLARP